MPSVLKSECVENGWSLQNRQHVYHAKYRVTTDTRGMAAITVVAGAQLSTPDPVPAYFASFALFGASDPSSLAQDMSATTPDPDKHACVWEVAVTWKPLDGPQDDDRTSSSDPSTWRPRIDMDYEDVEVLVENGWNEDALPNVAVPGDTAPREVDTYGPMTNACGQQSDTPYTETKQLQILVIRKVFVDEVGNSALDQINDLQQQFVNRLNENPFYGAPAKKAWCRSIRPSSEMSAGGFTYREAEFRIAADADGFSYKMVNCGWKHFEDVFDSDLDDTFRVLVDAKVLDKEATEDEGHNVMVPVAEPVNLALTGYKVEDGKTGTVINWRTKEIEDFDGMGIGGS